MTDEFGRLKSIPTNIFMSVDIEKIKPFLPCSVCGICDNNIFVCGNCDFFCHLGKCRKKHKAVCKSTKRMPPYKNILEFL